MKRYLQLAKPRLTTHAQRAEMLEKTRWLQDFSWEHIKRLADYVEVYDVPENTLLFDEGDKASFMGIIIDGKVIVSKSTQNQKNQVIARLTKGKTFGEMSLVDGSVRSASVSTQQETVLIVLFHEKFENLLNDAAKLGVLFLLKISKLISANLRKTSALLIDSLDHQE